MKNDRVVTEICLDWCATFRPGTGIRNLSLKVEECHGLIGYYTI
jgi:hypothetical protein